MNEDVCPLCGMALYNDDCVNDACPSNEPVIGKECAELLEELWSEGREFTDEEMREW